MNHQDLGERREMRLSQRGLPGHPVWRAGLAVLLSLLVPLAALAQETPDPDEDYVKRFLEQYPRVEQPLALEAYANAARYDELYLGEEIEASLKGLHNDQGGLAWGLSYRMMSLNDMYRATGDSKYLDANLKCIQATLDATDDKRGKQLWTGRVVAAWGCEKYAERGRAVFAVHTGIICAPIFDFLLLTHGNPAYRSSLGEKYKAVLDGATTALAVHDRQWRDGPGDGEGSYIGMDQETVCENKPLPGNRIGAMGWALWLSWKVTNGDGAGNTTHRDRALAIGRYIKNRLTLAPDGAYYWPYWLSLEPAVQGQSKDDIDGEDTSHAGLTMALPLSLAADGQVFTAEDLGRFAKTVLNGFGRRTDGILISRITGKTDLTPSYLGEPTFWLPTAKAAPEVRTRIVNFYLMYRPKPSPLGIAQLMLIQK
jgi:hypothetical protein